MKVSWLKKGAFPLLQGLTQFNTKPQKKIFGIYMNNLQDTVLEIKTNCPVCESAKYIVLFYDHNRRDNIDCSGTYVQCKGCSLVYLRERPPWEEIVKLYSILDSDLTANPGKVDVAALRMQVRRPIPKWRRLLRKVRFRPHSWPLEPVPQGSKRLLDVGCGNGAKLFEFAQRGYEVYGVDVSTDAIKVCQELLPRGHFIRGELRETSLPTAYFDYIRIDNVLEHVPNPREVVRECYRLLKERGQLLIYVPHGKSFTMRFMKGVSISSWIPFHLQLFTKKALRHLMEEAGFTDIQIYNYNPPSWLPLSLVQLWKRKQPTLKLGHPAGAWLRWGVHPIGWLAAKLGIGEELIGISVKR